MTAMAHIHVAFMDADDDAELEVHSMIDDGLIDIAVDRLHLSWYGDDAKERLLSVLARLTDEVRSLP